MERKACLRCYSYINSEKDAGTNKDGSPNYDYCKKCYQKGSIVLGNDVPSNDVLLGVLLTMPLYAIIHIVACLQNIDNESYYMLLAFCRVAPIIIGVILSLQMYKDKASPLFGIIMVLLSCLYIYLFYDNYFVDHPGWTGFNSFFNYIGISLLTRILSCIYYGKLVGAKKGWAYFGISLGITVLFVLIIVGINAGA